MGACDLPNIVTMGDVTENAFLSGFYGVKEPGILEKTGETTAADGVYLTVGDMIILIKDFTTVLSMRREKKGAFLSQFREMYDGEFKRAFGTGETKVWRGRITVIAAVTPVLDRHYSIFSTLGERFLQVRSSRPDSPVAGEWAIRQQGNEMLIRRDLRGAVNTLFEGANSSPPELPPEAIRRLAMCGELVAIARTHVYRESFGGRNIQYVPEPEANTRIAKGLAGIARGIASLLGKESVGEAEMQDVARVGLDSIPDLRRRILIQGYLCDRPERVSAPQTTLNRALEDLAELGLLVMEIKVFEGEPPEKTFSLAAKTKALFDEIVVDFDYLYKFFEEQRRQVKITTD